MAASSKKKKVVGKDDLRRLMKEKRNDVHSSQRKIDSPLAKYNSLGQLRCVLCDMLVKSELLWNAHIQGRTHKESVAALKAKKEAESRIQPPPPPAVKRRKIQDSQDRGTKSRADTGKKELPSDFFDSNSSSAKAKTSLAIGDYSSSSEEEEEEEEVDRAPAPAPGSTNSGTVAPGLPSDFFDSGIAPAAPSTEPAKPIAEMLPEGFFDDPKMDAKVRKVEYRDKMEDEWELFQKTIKEETTVSAQIQEEDDVLAQTERNIDEIDEQLHRWSKVDELAKKKEEIMTKEGEKPGDGEEEGSDIDEQEFEDLLDWRSKKAWK